MMGNDAMTHISPSRALYIKLGRGGKNAKECIQNRTLRLGFIEADHQSCLQGDWDRVREQLAHIQNEGTRTRAVNQIRDFYEAREDVLWIIFHGGRLWWCHSEPEITLKDDNTKTRPVIGQWKNSSIREEPLSMDRLSGKLLAVQRYQGTICSVHAFDYLVNRINGTLPPQVKEAEEAYSNLMTKLEPLIRDLHWRDFETLMDLIFRQAGWQRLGKAGGPQKTIDLDLFVPITAKRYAVQIKSQAGRRAIEEYRKRFETLKGDYDGFYFVVHSPSDDLDDIPQDDHTPKVKLMLPKDIAQQAVQYGLAEWIINKAG